MNLLNPNVLYSEHFSTDWRNWLGLLEYILWKVRQDCTVWFIRFSNPLLYKGISNYKNIFHFDNHYYNLLWHVIDYEFYQIILWLKFNSKSLDTLLYNRGFINFKMVSFSPNSTSWVLDICSIVKILVLKLLSHIIWI